MSSSLLLVKAHEKVDGRSDCLLLAAFVKHDKRMVQICYAYAVEEYPSVIELVLYVGEPRFMSRHKTPRG